MEHAEVVAIYAKRRPSYLAFTEKLDALLRTLLDLRSIHATVESRTKTVDSFAAKIQREGKLYADPLTQVTDLSGLRIVTRTTLDVDAVLRLLDGEFGVDAEGSVDKATILDPTQFGYVSKHVIVRLVTPRSLTSEWQPFGSYVAEIQVRTFVQHAWANISRALEYTREEDVPRPLRRRLHRLSALFELADDELKAIWSEGSVLVDRYRRLARADTTTNVELNVDSYLAFLRESSAVKDLVDFVESLGISVTDSTLVSRDVAMFQRVGFETVGDVAQLLRSNGDWAKPFLEDYFRSSHSKALATHTLSLDRNGTVLLVLIGTYPEIFTPTLLEHEFGWGFPERVLAAALRHRPR